MDLLAEGVEGVTELLGDIFLATSLDEDGTKGFVEALRIARRLEKEKATRCVVHNSFPRCESF